jgi:lipoprotein Spr
MKKIITICILLLTVISTNAQQTKVDSATAKFIKEWSGVRYKLGGTTKKGIDCSGLNKKFYQSVFHVEIPDVCSDQYDSTIRVGRDSLRPGDLVFFKSSRSPSGWHCGCYIGNDKFLHAPQRNDYVRISSFKEGTYEIRFKSGGRLITGNYGE